MARVNTNGHYLCMANEGFAPKPYRCPAKVLTQGFGHTAAAGPPPLGGEWEVDEGYEIFVSTFGKYAERTAAQIGPRAMAALNDNQFSALVSFVYNTGSLKLRSGQPSGLLRAVQAGRFDDVPAELAKWNRAGGKVMPGLTRRREAEAALFNGNTARAKALSGPIPLVNERGRISGTIKEPAFGKPPVLLAATHPDAGAEVAPTATPTLTTEERTEAIAENKTAITGAVTTAGGGIATNAVDTGLSTAATIGIAAVAVVVVVAVGFWVWRRVRQREEERFA